jgi:hypothetical protein
MLIADKAFDADEHLIEPLAATDKAAVIPPKGGRKMRRGSIGRLIKRAILLRISLPGSSNPEIATRYDKTARNFLAPVHLPATVFLA